MQFQKRKWILLSVLAVAASYAYQKRQILFSVGTVLLYAGALTLLLTPVCRQFEQRGIPVPVSAFLAVVLILAVLVLLLSVFIPYLVTHTAALIRRSTPTAGALLGSASGVLKQLGLNLLSHQSFTDLIGKALSNATALFARMGVSVAAQTGRFFFSLVIAYYMLCERKALASHLLLCIPLCWRTTFLCAMRGCKNAVLGYLSGLIKTSAFITAATYLGLLLLGVPDAFLLSLFMGLFEVLPYIGPVLAAIPILLSAVPLGIERTLLSLLLVILVQQIEGNVISPYFTASSTSIHPFAALIGVFVFGSLMGIWGILLAVPIMVTARSICWSLRQATIL